MRLNWLKSSCWAFMGSCLFLSSCAFSSSTMTAPAYENISIGASIKEVKTQVGEPYRMTADQSGVQQYHYIERIETGPGVISQNTYVLTVVDGEVVNKQVSHDAQSLRVQVR